MINRAEAVSFFRDLATTSGICVDPKLLDTLPPYLCHRLIVSGFDEEECTPIWARVGRHESDGEFWNSIYLSPGGFGPLLPNNLLDGHLPLNARGVFDWVKLALDELAARAPETCKYVQDWCSVIVWMQRQRSRTDLTELTSVSIPILPFAAFVTKKIIRHIPPVRILPVVSFYGIQENLFHEALHQQLTAYIIASDDLLKPAALNHKIHIPWRNTEWPLDRALHAAWVYRGLLAFRKRMVDATPTEILRTIITESCRESEQALLFLKLALLNHVEHFGDSGVDLIESF